ncbi:MAG TPA: hypothetical protein PLY40_04355 [Bacillota bacterium]|nr:hypothetical protein [Bacillota bacterium]
MLSSSLSDAAGELDQSFGYLALGKKDHTLLLNRFTTDDILTLMAQVGLTKHLGSLGFRDLKVNIIRDEAQIYHLKIYHAALNPENLLIDLRLSQSRYVPDRRLFTGDAAVLDMVMIEWFTAQHPGKTFDDGRPQLPGQSRPGLGCLGYMMELMYLVGKTLLADGFMDVPDHFHGAVMYARKFKFFDPVKEAILQAVLRDLKQFSLADLSWGFITKTILDRSTGAPQEYEPSEQVFPLSRCMKDYFNSTAYRDRFIRVYQNKKFAFAYESMLERRKELLRTKKIEEL